MPSVSVESLESRALLATATGSFVAPDLTPYVRAALQGANTGPATIQRMLTSLQGQLNSGPLAALQAGAIDPSAFDLAVNDLVTSYQANVALQLSPRFPNITKILTAEGSKVSSLIAAYDAQLDAGLITDAVYTVDVADAISSLTGGPLRPLHTPNRGYVQATQIFVGQLNALVPTLAPGANPALTPQQLQTVVAAESQGYSAAMTASLVTHPYINRQVTLALTDLNNAVANIAATNPADATVLYTQAINAFDQALLGPTGLFGPLGVHKNGLKK